MPKPKEMDVIRRAYELWQHAGEPIGRDEEFYLAAKAELQARLDRGDPAVGAEDGPIQAK